MTEPRSQLETSNVNHQVPYSGIVYGNIIYWGTILGTVVSILGSILTFTTDSNLVNPINEIAAVWQGKSVEEIWLSAGSSVPHHHWYIALFDTGNGLTMAGIAIAVLSVTFGIIGTAIVLLREKNVLFGSFASLSAGITIYAMI